MDTAIPVPSFGLGSSVEESVLPCELFPDLANYAVKISNRKDREGLRKDAKKIQCVIGGSLGRPGVSCLAPTWVSSELHFSIQESLLPCGRSAVQTVVWPRRKASARVRRAGWRRKIPRCHRGNILPMARRERTRARVRPDAADSVGTSHDKPGKRSPIRSPDGRPFASAKRWPRIRQRRPADKLLPWSDAPGIGLCSCEAPTAPWGEERTR
jgi:hypothetical protein